MNVLLGAGLWVYLLLLPLAHAGLYYNFYAKQRCPGSLQRALDALHELVRHDHLAGVLSGPLNFFIGIDERKADGTTRRSPTWGAGRASITSAS